MFVHFLQGGMNGETIIFLICITDINTHPHHSHDGQHNYSKNTPVSGNSNYPATENGQAKNLEGETAFSRNR